MNNDQNPLESLDQWDDDVRDRYAQDEASGTKSPSDFRDYDDAARDCVREFYRQNHLRQTVEFVRASREKYLPCRTRQMGI